MRRKLLRCSQPVSLHGGAEDLVELQQGISFAEQNQRPPTRSAVDRRSTLKACDETESHLERAHRNGFPSPPRRIDEPGSQTFVISNMMQRDVQTFRLERPPLPLI